MTPGNYRVRAEALGFVGAYHDGSTYEEENPATVTVPDGAPVTGIDIVLPDGGSISGQVTDFSNGLPLQSVYLYVTAYDNPYIWWSLYAYTDASGDYRIDGVPDRDDLVVSASIQDYVPYYYDGQLNIAFADRLSISSGSDLSGIDFQLHPGGILRAAVFAPSGLPVGTPGMPQILDANIREIEKDSSDDLWFGTDSGVMSIVASATRGIHPYNSDLPGEEVRDLSIAPTGTRYYATDGGIGRQTGMAAVEAFTTGNSDLPYDDCTAVEAVSTSDVYIGSPTGDFTRWNGTTTFTNYTHSDRGEPSASPITSLAHDSTGGDILIGTSNGMTIYDIGAGTFSRLTTVGGLPSDQVNTIAVTLGGTRWIGTDAGVYVPNTGDLYDTVDGLPSNQINDIYIASVTQVWIATSGGIAHFDDGTINAYTTATSGLFTNTCFSILERGGEVFIGSNNGLDILSGGAFRHIARQNTFVSLSAQDPDTGQGGFGGSSSTIAIDLGGLTTGDYTLATSASGYPSKYFDDVFNQNDATLIHVVEGMETAQRYVIELEPYGGIVGSVTDPMGNPVASGTVFFYPVGQSDYSTSTSVFSGNFQSTSIPGGDYYVVYFGSGLPATFYPGVFALDDAAPVHVDPGVTTGGIGIPIPSSANGSISGQALDSLGRPYPFISVNASGVFATNAFRSTTTDKDGNYTLNDLLPGNYRVSMSPFGLPNVFYSSTFDQGLFQAVGVSSGEAVTGIDMQVPTFTPGTISGIVEDGGGNPVAGAEVSLTGGLNYPTIVTGGDGLFEFSNLPPFSFYYLQAVAPSYIPDTVSDIALASGGAVGPITLTLSEYPPTSVSGQATDASGNPLWGATLYIDYTAGDYSTQVQTDWEGRYYLPDFPPGPSDFSVYFNGYNGIFQSVDLSPGPNTQDFVFTIDPSYATLSGIVTDTNGVPQAGLGVQVSGPSSVFARTDKSGRYLASSLSPGTYTIEMSDFSENSAPLTDVNVAAGEIRNDLDLSVDKVLAFITGTVAIPGGAPFENPYPYTDNYDGVFNYSDNYGKYGICGIEAPTGARVQVDENGYRSQFFNGKPSLATADTIEIAGSGEAPGIDFNLVEGDRIEGTVRDTLGRPLPSVSVYSENLETSDSQYSSTDLFGNYRLAGLYPGDHTVYCSRSNYYQEYYNDKPFASEADIVAVASGIPTTGIDFEIGLGGAVSGQVLDATGDPYSSGTVYAYASTALDSSVRSTSLNASGEYSMNALRPGSYYIQASVSGLPRVFHPSAYSTQSAMSIALTEGSSMGGVDITVPASAETASVSGTITDTVGDPINGTSVRVVGVDGYTGSYFANTDSNGNYLRTDIPPGTYVVAVSESNTPLFYYTGTYDRAMAQRIELTPGEVETGIDIQTVDKQLATLSGTVRDGMANPLGDVAIELSGDSSYYSVNTLGDGTYEIPGVFPNSGYTLSAFKPGYFPGQVEDVTIPPNGSETRDFVLVGFEPGRVAGKVRDVSGYAIDQVSISITGTNVDYELFAESDSFGDYLFDPLPAGSYTLAFSKSGYQYTQVSSVPVMAGNTSIRNVTMLDSSGTGSISGTIYDAGGNPTAGILVQVSDVSFRQVYSRLDGTYRLHGLSPGTYSVALPNETAKSAKGTVMVMEGQDTSGVDFNLATTYGTISGHIMDTMGTPLAGAYVSPYPLGHSFYPSSVYSGTSGLYILTRVLNEGGKDYAVEATLDRYVTTYYETALNQSNANPVHLNVGESADGIDIAMAPGATVSGTVSDGDTGEPISGGTVYFSNDSSYYTSIDAGGTFRIRTLPAGTYTLYTFISGYSAEYYNNTAYQDEASSITLSEGEVREGIAFTPSRSASIAGMVLDESGTPYTSGSVRAYDVTRSPDDYFSGSIGSGMYSINNIPAGTYYVYTSISGKPAVFHPSSFSPALAQMVTVTPGQMRNGIDITVPSSVENGSISGTILDRFGAVDTSIFARVIGTDGTNHNQTYNLDESGLYLATGLLPGTYLVALGESNNPDYYYGNTFDRSMATKVLLDPGAAITGIDIMGVEQPQATLQGFVRGQGGTPLAGARLDLDGDAVGYSDLLSLSDGSYRFSNVFPAADYTLTASYPGYYTQEIENVELLENQTVNLDVNLVSFERATIQGNVQNASGSILPGANVYIYGGSPYIYISLLTDYLGNYKADSFSPGTYTVQASKSGYVSQTLNGVNIPPGSPVNRNFVLDFDLSYGVVTGTVTDSIGSPAYGIQVRSDNFQSATTKFDGTYELAGLSPGTYTISLPDEDESGNPSQENVVVEAGATTPGVDFVLQVTYSGILGNVIDNLLNPVYNAQVGIDPVGHDYYPPTVYSGYDGSFIVPRVRTDPARDYRVRASMDGFVETYYGNTIDEEAATVIHLNPGESFSPASIQLIPGARISGTVQEEGTGRPIGSGSVVADNGDRSYYASIQDAGNYELNVLPPGDYEVYTSISKYVTEYYLDSNYSDQATPISLSEGEQVEGIDFAPERGGSISGIVRNVTGDPIASGTVYAFATDRSFDDSRSNSLDSSGEYRITDLTSGQYYVLASVSGSPVVYHGDVFFPNESDPVAVMSALETSGVDITIPGDVSPGSISGKILNLFGEAYRYANVYAQGADGTGGSYYVQTDENGRYTRTGLPVGSYTVALSESGRPYFYYGAAYDREEAHRVFVAPEESVGGINIMAPGRDDASVLGRVENSSGDPLSGIGLTLTDFTNYYYDTTGPDGVFSFPFVFPGSYTLSGIGQGYLPGETELDVDPNEIARGVVLVLDSSNPGSIAGVVTDASGKPLEDVSFNIYHDILGYISSVQSTRYGEYFEGDLPPGSYSVYPSLSGYQSPSFNGVSVQEGMQTLLNVELQPSTSTGRVSGQILDGNGRPAYRVQVRSEGPSNRTAYTYADGTYVLANLSAGDYRIYLPDETGPVIEQLSVQVMNGSLTEGVDFSLDRAYGTVTGAVFERGTVNPVHGGAVSAYIFEGGDFINTADISYGGLYQVGRVPASATGGVRLFASSEGYASAYWMDSPVQGGADPVVLNAMGDATDVNFGLDPEAVLQGRLTDTVGAPISGSYAYATVFEPSGTSNFSDTANSNGWYEIRGLPGSDYRLEFSAQNFEYEYYNDVPVAASATLVSAAPGSVQTFDAELAPVNAISGSVVDVTGNPILTAFVDVYNTAENTVFRVFVDNLGNYSFQGASSGDYRLRAYATGYYPQWWLGQGVAPLSNTLELPDETLQEGIDFILFGTNGTEYNLVQDGIIDARDLIALLIQGKTTAPNLFEFSLLWRATQLKLVEIDEAPGLR
jgi:protocatechuate 3,4-dioxygenase beta subunit